MEEKDFLDKVAETYKTAASPVSKWNIDSYIRIYKKHMKELSGGEGYGLELGCSSGYSTLCLSELVCELDVVDGSRKMLDRLDDAVQSKGNVNLIYSLFEELCGVGKYDYIFCSYVMEHVADPASIIEICYKLLKEGGKMFITVPNARALSRQMALKMKLISSLYDLTENDIAHGHRRVYDLVSLELLVRDSKFCLEQIGGTFIKPYADFQINEMIKNNIIGFEQLEGMQLLAEDYPDLSGSIYVTLNKI